MNYIKESRIATGMSIEDVAKALGIRPSAYKRIEDSKQPTAKTRQRVARILGVPTSKLSQTPAKPEAEIELSKLQKDSLILYKGGQRVEGQQMVAISLRNHKRIKQIAEITRISMRELLDTLVDYGIAHVEIRSGNSRNDDDDLNDGDY